MTRRGALIPNYPIIDSLIGSHRVFVMTLGVSTAASAASAFVSSASFRREIHAVSPAWSSPIPNAVLHRPLYGVKTEIADICFNFFDTIKVPSTLIAASTLAALFTFTREVKETYTMSKRTVMLLRLYHVFSLLSFCLSLTTMLTSQAATTSLLLKSNQLLASSNVDAYSFLRQMMNFEFLLTRWAFIMSVFLFFFSTTIRIIVEFGLFSRKRRVAGTMVVSMMSGVFCFLLSSANTTLTGLPGLWTTTKELATIVWYRTYIGRDRLQIASVVLLGIAALCSLRFLFPGSVAHDQLLDSERYT